uniref:Uncharacterized protein n=1 Tax=Rhizophora mucronata TaxID=61149 RepID=A0A2P2Q5F6_RHIMU
MRAKTYVKLTSLHSCFPFISPTKNRQTPKSKSSQ